MMLTYAEASALADKVVLEMGGAGNIGVDRVWPGDLCLETQTYAAVVVKHERDVHEVQTRLGGKGSFYLHREGGLTFIAPAPALPVEVLW